MNVQELERTTRSICAVLAAWLVIAGAYRQTATAKQAEAKGVYDVRAYGALGDGKTLDTKAIQAAIDACHKAGGGKAYLRGGTFLSGSLFLKSNVTLYLEAGAMLLGSPNVDDYVVHKPAFRAGGPSTETVRSSWASPNISSSRSCVGSSSAGTS